MIPLTLYFSRHASLQFGDIKTTFNLNYTNDLVNILGHVLLLTIVVYVCYTCNHMVYLLIIQHALILW